MAKPVADWLEANKKALPAEKAAFISAACEMLGYGVQIGPNKWRFGDDVVEYIGEPEEEKGEPGADA